MSTRFSCTGILLFMAVLLVSQNSYAQKRQVCGFDNLYKRQLRNAQAATKIQSANLKIGNVQRSLDAIRKNTRNRDVMPGPGGSTLYQIPVVVHIMSRPGDAVGTVNNPSDATIIAMIDFLNKVYEGANISSGGVNTPLRFVLARRTPDCQATNGINRVQVSNSEYVTNGLQDGTSGPGMPEDALKSLSRWSVNEYYNIWIVHKIYSADPGTTTNGYAYFPGGAGDLDGTVLIGEVSNGTAQTLPHEMGHALALYHTFEGGDDGVNCPANTGNCLNDGDKVCDTDPHLINYNCPLATDINSCTSAQWGLLPKNIMGYFDCRDRFSPGQGSRMQATMLTERYGLVSSLGGTAPSGNAVTTIDHKNVVANDNNNNDMGPVKVVLNNLYYQSEGYKATTQIAYEDKTCTMGTLVNASNGYEIMVDTRLNDQTVKVWIDLNDDGTYSANELIGTSTGTTGGDYTHKIPLTSAQLSLAGTVYNKPLRMRIASDFSGNSNYDFNSELEYGQMEDFAVTISNATLPVSFGDITAMLKDGQLEVNWSTIIEVNNSHFEIEASADGKTFSKIGEINSLATNGSSNKELKYSFSKNATDAAAWLGLSLLTFVFGLGSTTKKRSRKLNKILMLSGVLLLGFGACNKKDVSDAIDSSKSVFIRIKQVDKDGGFKYSNSIKVVRQ